MNSSGVKVVRIHAVDRGQAVLTFSTEETCWVDLVEVLGTRPAQSAYDTLKRFADIRVDERGGLTWGDLSLPGSEVYAAAKRQARCSKRPSDDKLA